MIDLRARAREHTGKPEKEICSCGCILSEDAEIRMTVAEFNEAKASFAEQVVRQCAEIADKLDQVEGGRIKNAIRREFNLADVADTPKETQQ